MKIGDKVEIVDITKMWDKEIYYRGWGLTDKETLMDYYNANDVPEFSNLEYFENKDVVSIISSTAESIKDGYMLEIELTDNDSKDFKCYSQTYSLDELKSFCKVV